jgi:phosphatidylserine/phosphatidylglycerophosphate/cardiolipin synthase-like enzyme
MFNRLRQICRAFWPYALLVALIVFVTAMIAARIAIARYDSQFRVVYSLDRRNTDSEIIRLVNQADHYAYFAVYYFSKTDIADALIRARQRGLDVRGITDAAASLDTNKNVVQTLRAAGITVETQKHQDGIMHMKAIVTDKAYASGSYNWTASATEANDEVLEIGTDKSVHDQYLSIIKKVLEANR